MAIKQKYITSGGSIVFPRTSIDNIVKSTESSTEFITSGGVIKRNYLDLGGTLTTSYVSSANVIPTSAVNGFSTAAKNAASTYVHSSGVIPVSAVTDLGFISSTYVPLAENGWTREVSAGAGVTVTTNSDNFPERDVTIALKDYDTIETATTGATVTIAPGKAYRIDATTGSKTLAISSFDTGLFGRESHIELFVANAGYIHVGDNVDLIDALEPDAVNNCTVRFHDGHAIISVEDHVGAYMVNNTGTGSSTSGTLAYGLKQTATASSYIGFRSELNTSSVPTGGATATVMKHIVGNGIDVGPTITGNLIVSAGATVRDVKLSGVTVTSGNAKLANVYCAGNVTAGTGCTMTLGDVYIPSGSTVAVSGGGLAIEKVTGNGGTIDLGSSYISSGVMVASGVSFTNSPSVRNGGVVYVAQANSLSAQIYNCNFNGCNVGGNGGGIAVMSSGCSIYISGGIVSGCSANQGGFLFVNAPGAYVIEDVDFVANSATLGGALRWQLLNSNNVAQVKSCTFANNTATSAGAAIAIFRTNCELTDCTFEDGQDLRIENTDGRYTFVGSNVLKGTISYATNNTGYVTISSGAIIDLTGNTNATPINPGKGIVFAAEGASVIYDHDSTGAALGSSGTATIAGGTFSRLANGGTIITDVLGGSGSYDGIKLKTITSNTTINAYTGGNKVFRNCTFYDRISISSTNSAMQISLTIGGTITAKNFAGLAISLGSSSASRVVVTIEPNTTIDATSIATSYPNIIWTVATLIVGSGVTVVNNGTSVAVTAGTYSNVSLKKDGSIVAI